jgi:hypothetical protein
MSLVTINVPFVELGQELQAHRKERNSKAISKPITFKGKWDTLSAPYI